MFNAGPASVDRAARTFSTYEEVDEIAQSILRRVKCRPKLGIICGSGLGSLADIVEDQEVVPYTEITGFPNSTVLGHDGKLVFGTLSGKSVVVMKGRAHCYEGYSVQQTALPVRTMKLMGVTTLLITNASGGVNTNFNVGDIMLIKDHFDLALGYVNPLIGPNDERFGTRFPAMSHAYDAELRSLTKATAEELGFSDFFREGSYCMMVGPTYETVLGGKFLRLIEADAVGMSTVPEVITAVHCGMRVLALSLISNMITQGYVEPVFTTHDEVLETGRRRGQDLQRLVSALVKKVTL